MQTSDFEYTLPEELIAQTPPPRRSDARLLVLRRCGGGVSHHSIGELPQLLSGGDLAVFNDTRVLPARLFGRRLSGGRVELLLLHPLDGPRLASARGPVWRALVRPARRVRPDEALCLVPPEGGTGEQIPGEPVRMVRLLRHLGAGEAEVCFEGPGTADVPALLRHLGQMPLPPYIRTRLRDAERYQTVFARQEGSAAAPTAGLHFTPELLEALDRAGVHRACVTLHVGLGTFRPVAVDRLADHRLHAEWFGLGADTARAVAEARARGGRVLAVGTTVVRTLETQAGTGGLVQPGSGWTDLFILPGRKFRVVDALLTNFHLPRSTLLMLVCAFAGREAVLAAYREAVRQRYRFFSFGGAMIIL